MESKVKGDAQQRKATPIASGVMDYFPDALIAIAQVSYVGNQQHNPGQPLHWDKSKSTDHGDCLIRHFVDRGKIDTDGVSHTAKMAWRALAMLQMEIDNAWKEEQSATIREAEYAAKLQNASVMKEIENSWGRCAQPITIPDSTGYSTTGQQSRIQSKSDPFVGGKRW